jgi:hypothetical protein
MNSILPIFDADGIWMLRILPLSTFVERLGTWLYGEVATSITEGHSESCSFGKAYRIGFTVFDCGFVHLHVQRAIRDENMKGVEDAAEVTAALAVLIGTMKQRSLLADQATPCHAFNNPGALRSKYDH